jgi:hypothetical protein
MDPLTIAEMIFEFGEDLAKLNAAFDKRCQGLHFDIMCEVNAIPHQEHLDEIAQAFRALGLQLEQDVYHAEEAEDRRRANPLSSDYRRFP